MVKLIGTETTLHISFSLAAFIFSVVLYILIRALGTGQVHKNLQFRTLTITIVFGNLISILDNIFRDSGQFPVLPEIKLLLLLLVFQANILLTYYMALYMEGFFDDYPMRSFFLAFNTILSVSSVIFTTLVYTLQVLRYEGEAMLTTVPMWVRVMLGYVYELYYLFYTIMLFINQGRKLSSRAMSTAVAAFTVAIGGVLLELVNTFNIGSGILFNYFGAVIALYIFYIGVETPDYQNLLQTLSDLDKAKKAADIANRSKSDFLANMSHEIRTPINAVLGMNEMILREADNEAILSYSENIRNAGGTLLGLINDILDFSKIEAGKIEILPVEYDLAEFVNSLVNMIHSRADEKGLLLILNFDPRMPGRLFGDEVRIKQVIMNILTNAVKYTERGSVTFSIGFERIAAEPDQVILNVAVMDTGIGIRAEDIPKLFVEFERIDEKRNRSIEGTGLGMSITRSLLELMGSTLQVESIYGVGSTFSFALKQKVVNWDPMGDYKVAYNDHISHRKEEHERFTAPEARVLVVDDNTMNLKVFRSLIKRTKVQVDSAGSGDEGLTLAAKNRYDMIFLDHMMPKKDGIETLKELRSDAEGINVKTPAICLTANAISGARERYLKAGFEDYLAKPIDTGELEKQLLQYLPKDKIREWSGEEEREQQVTSAKPATDLSSLMDCGVKVEVGVGNCQGEDIFRQVLKIFRETIDENTEALEGFYKATDLDEYTTLVHSIKSSARTIGAMELGEDAMKLENAGRSGDIIFINAHHADFLEKYQSFKAPLEAVLDGASRDLE